MSPGDPRHLAHSAAAGPLPPLLDGPGRCLCLPGHHRAQSPLQEAEHSPDAGLGQEHPHPADAGHSLHAGPETGMGKLSRNFSKSINHIGKQFCTRNVNIK